MADKKSGESRAFIWNIKFFIPNVHQTDGRFPACTMNPEQFPESVRLQRSIQIIHSRIIISAGAGISIPGTNELSILKTFICDLFTAFCKRQICLYKSGRLTLIDEVTDGQ